MRRERPFEFSSSALVVRNHVPKTIAGEFYVWAPTQLLFDFRSDCIFMERCRRLVRQRLHDSEHFFLAHVA